MSSGPPFLHCFRNFEFVRLGCSGFVHGEAHSRAQMGHNSNSEDLKHIMHVFGVAESVDDAWTVEIRGDSPWSVYSNRKYDVYTAEKSANKVRTYYEASLVAQQAVGAFVEKLPSVHRFSTESSRLAHECKLRGSASLSGKVG